MAKPKLTEQWDAKTGRFQFWRKEVGGRRFVLTSDRSQSEVIAAALTAAWTRLKSTGSQWDDATVRTCYASGGIDRQASDKSSHQIPTAEIYNGMDLTHATIVRAGSATPPAAASTASVAPAKGLTLYAAIDVYLADYKPRVKWSRYQREISAMATFKGHRKDLLLMAIDADTLRADIAHFRSRPITRTGLPMAVATVQTTVKAIKSLFDWLDASDKWIAPRRFDRLFKLRYDNLKTALERKKESLGVEVFTIVELAKLYAAATQRQRLYIALALNTGETAQGLADFLKMDLTKKGDSYTIDRMRTKTNVQGVYPLWKETADLVLAEMNKDANRPLLFYTSDGNPLVHPNKSNTGRTDVIYKSWSQGPNALRRRVKDVRINLTYKTLRKTGATLIEKLTGSEKVAELYLSHKGGSVAAKHYLAKDFTDLADALLKLRITLEPMFAASESKGADARKVS